MATISEFNTGYCTHLGCIAVKGTGLRVCQFPARAWLLEADGRRWLWDTGYAGWFARATRSGIFRVYRHLTPVHFTEQQALAQQLRARGITGQDIDGIILSHFHADHIAGLRDFPHTSCICSGEGWRHVRNLRGLAALREAFIPQLIPPEFESSLRFIEQFATLALPAELAPFTHGYLLPGSDGQIFLVDLPGHAAGHIGAFVLTDAGWTLLAADAAWAPANYQALRGPSRLAHLVLADPVAYSYTLKKLNQLWRNGKVTIRLCHEGDL